MQSTVQPKILRTADIPGVDVVRGRLTGGRPGVVSEQFFGRQRLW